MLSIESDCAVLIYIEKLVHNLKYLMLWACNDDSSRFLLNIFIETLEIKLDFVSSKFCRKMNLLWVSSCALQHISYSFAL